MTNQQILQQSEALKDYVVECRRAIHRMAEVSGTEVRTSAFLRREIEAAGLPVESVSKTGLLATLETGRPGPHIALRADIDALPVPENPNNLAGPRVCVSDNPETCHACGHDAHSAMLLGAMKALTACRDTLCGTIYFCFEEGEENGGGVAGMLDALAKRQVDTCWAIHVYAGLESGKICLDSGPRMAGAAGVDITVHGKGGHGSRPDMACNPVFCAASILTNTATAWVNQITAGETVTLGVTSIHGGESANVIPNDANILGSLRFFNAEEGHRAVRIFKSVAEHTAAMNNCTVEFGPRFEVICKPVINDPAYAALARAAVQEVLPAGAVAPCEPWYASESFSRYCAKYPSVMAHLGINRYPLLQIAQDGWLPAVFKKTTKSGYPYLTYFAFYLISIFPILTGMELDAIVSLVMIPTMLVNIYVNLGCLILPKKYPDQWAGRSIKIPLWLYNICCVLGAFCAGVVAFNLFVDLTASDAVVAVVILVALGGLSLLRLKQGAVKEADLKQKKESIIREAIEAVEEEVHEMRA